MKLAGFALVASLCLAQQIELRPQLRAGDTFALLATHTRDSAVWRTPIEVRVLEAGPAGFVLAWVQGESDLSGFPDAQNDVVAAAALNAAWDLHLEAELSPKGEYKRLRNAGAALGELQKRADTIVGLVPQQAQAEVRRYLAPQALLSTAAQDIQIYFKLHGVALRPGEKIEAEIKQTRIDGSVVPAYFEVRMEGGDAQSSSLSAVTRYDASRRESAYYLYDRTLGIMRGIRSEVTVSGRRAEAFELQLTKTPAR